MPIFDLTLRSPLYQGEFVGVNREATLDWVPSDTLFAALATAWAQQGVDVNARLAAFETQTPPLLITSAFPRAGTVRFYLAPPRKPAYLFDVPDLSPKALKKITWLSHGVLEQLQKGETPAFAQDDNFLHGGSIWLTKDERTAIEPLLSVDEEGRPSLWRKQIVPHVTVDRAASASNLFHTGRVTFGKGCGLWFGVRGEVEWVRSALKYLSDAGLGGLRSTGHGAFSCEERTTDLPEVTTGEWGLCLSRYAPTEAEVESALQQPQSTYALVRVGGWCQDDDGHHWRRRAVRMLAEGAVLPASARGKLVDVKPEHVMKRAVYRSGLAFLIPAGKLAEAA